MKSTAFILFLLTVSLLVACGGGTTDADSGQDTGIQDVATDLGTQDPGPRIRAAPTMALQMRSSRIPRRIPDRIDEDVLTDATELKISV